MHPAFDGRGHTSLAALVVRIVALFPETLGSGSQHSDVEGTSASQQHGRKLGKIMLWMQMRGVLLLLPLHMQRTRRQMKPKAFQTKLLRRRSLVLKQ